MSIRCLLLATATIYSSEGATVSWQSPFQKAHSPPPPPPYPISLLLPGAAGRIQMVIKDDWVTDSTVWELRWGFLAHCSSCQVPIATTAIQSLLTMWRLFFTSRDFRPRCSPVMQGRGGKTGTKAQLLSATYLICAKFCIFISYSLQLLRQPIFKWLILPQLCYKVLHSIVIKTEKSPQFLLWGSKLSFCVPALEGTSEEVVHASLTQSQHTMVLCELMIEAADSQADTLKPTCSSQTRWKSRLFYR